MKSIIYGLLLFFISSTKAITFYEQRQSNQALLKKYPQLLPLFEAQNMQTLNVTYPTLTQIYLVKEAQRHLEIKEAIHVYSHFERARATRTSWGKYCIAVPVNPDIDHRLFEIYHELAHIKHNDIAIVEEMLDGKETYQEILKSKKFQEDLGTMRTYRDLGNKALDKSTGLGMKMYEIFSQSVFSMKNTIAACKQLAKKLSFDKIDCHPYWKLPAEKEAYQKALYLRGIEQQADLLALQSLFKQNKLSAILSRLRFFIYARYQNQKHYVIDSENHHPSDIERAVYIAGFLSANQVNFTKEAQEFEHKGLCVSSDDAVSIDKLFTTILPAQ